MEVMICVPTKSDMSAVEREYPDIEQDFGYDDHERYFVGRASDDQPEGSRREWLTYNQAVACCGFVEGAIPGAETLIEGNGAWAQSMISRRDFSGLAISDQAKRAYQRTSSLFWRHYRRGKNPRPTRPTSPTSAPSAPSCSKS